MSKVTVQTQTFHAEDGYELTGTEYLPQQAAHSTLLINSGTAIPRGFYDKFARYAATQGFIVLSYDYRGIGDSAQASIKHSNIRYRDWGQKDVAAAIEYLSNAYPELPLSVLGHSTGGQQLGLAANNYRVNKAVFVAVSTGYWKGLFPNMKWLTLFLWRCYVPITTRLFGYGPFKVLGLGEDLPTFVVREWAAWCLEPSYMKAFFDGTGFKKSVDGTAFGDTYFQQLRCPIHAYCFSDDDIATQANVPPMLSLFSHTKLTQSWTSPQDIQQKAIGHLGFFRPTVGKELWDDAINKLKTHHATP